jgi:thymidylate synthase
MLFEAYRQITRYSSRAVEPATLAALHPGHHWLLARRWPCHVQAPEPAE